MKKENTRATISSAHPEIQKRAINLIIPFRFSLLKLIGAAGLRSDRVRTRGVYVYPKFGQIVLRWTIIMPPPSWRHRRVLSLSLSLSLYPLVVVCARERRLSIPLRHELAHTYTYTLYTVLSCTIFYRLLFVLCGHCAFPLHLSPLASIKAAPASYWNQTADSREESTLFRARLQDLLMVMGARLACQSKLRRLPALAFRGAINVEGAGLSRACPANGISLVMHL